MRRRQLLAAGLAAISASITLKSLPVLARQLGPDSGAAGPPMVDRQTFIDWMVKNRGESPEYLGERFDRFLHMVRNQDLYTQKDKLAFLLTPREKFCRVPNLARAYDSAFLDIGYGVTISGPHLVGRMTSAIDVNRGERVLEIGTGSGYQSAMLSYLTDQVFTIEIIKPLATRTRHLRQPDLRRLLGIPSDHLGERRWLLRLVRACPFRQDHCHLRHRPHSTFIAAATATRWRHGDPRRPSWRPACPQGDQEAAP